MAIVRVAVEGISDEPLAERILAAAGHQMGPVYGLRGKARLMRDLAGFNAAAKHHPWMVLRDLDHDAGCAAELVAEILPHPASKMRLRIAVRESEAWLLGDRRGIASFLRVSTHHVTTDPESLVDPKQHLVNLARRSRSRGVREGIVPEPGMSGSVGGAYTGYISEFISKMWNIERASSVCPSLDRCIQALRSLS